MFTFRFESKILTLVMRFCVALLLFSASLSAELSEAPLCSARPCPTLKKEREGAPTFQASFLFWQSKEGGLEFASKSFNPTTIPFDEKFSVPDFAWHSGFKLESGYNLPYDGWDAAARYTFSHGTFTSLKKHFDSQIAPIGVGIIPLWHYPFIDNFRSSPPLRFGHASANWKMFFNSLNFELGRDFFSFPTLPIRMHLGIALSWIRQSYHADYENGATILGIIQAPPPVSLQYLDSGMRFSSRARGIGPRAGFNSKWHLGQGFSLIADAALSLLATWTRIHTKYEDLLLDLGSGETIAPTLFLKEKVQELIPAAEARLGFNWGRCFCKCSRPIYFSAALAYEVQYWWSQNHVRRNFAFGAPGNQWDMRGDLQMQGLTASLRWDY